MVSLIEIKAYLGIPTTDTGSDVILNIFIRAAIDAIETYCGRRFERREYKMDRHSGDNTSRLMLHQWPVISVERIAMGTVGALNIDGTSSGGYSATVEVTRDEGDPRESTQLRLIINGGANDGTNTVSFATYTTLTTLAAQVTTFAGWSSSAVSGYGAYKSTELIPVGALDAGQISLALDTPDDWLTGFTVDFKTGEVGDATFPCGFQNIYVDYTAGYSKIPRDLELTVMQIVADINSGRTVNRALRSEKIGDYSYTIAAGREADASIVAKYSKDLDKYKR
ncbi:unnamed protein product, partial [marine sediment metagenome]